MTTDEPTIDYPTSWEYRLIGRDEELLRIAVVDVLGARERDLDLSRRSSGGKYVSLVLRLVVRDREDRVGIYRELLAHDAVRAVL